MTLMEVANNYKDELVDGIAWIVLYKKGCRWCAFDFYPEYDKETGIWVNEFPSELESVKEILKTDANAIMVNGYNNFIDMENCKERADRLRYLYESSRGCFLRDCTFEGF